MDTIIRELLSTGAFEPKSTLESRRLSIISISKETAFTTALAPYPEIMDLYQKAVEARQDHDNELTTNYFVHGFKIGLLLGMEANTFD